MAEHGDENLESRSPEDENAAAEPTPQTVVVQPRRYFTRRNAFRTGVGLLIALAALIGVLFVAYRIGYVDQYIAGRIKGRLAEFGIRAEIGRLKVIQAPLGAELRDIKLYDSTTGDQVGQIERLNALVSLSDLFAPKLTRNIDITKIDIYGLQAWVKFDAQGNANFRNLVNAPDRSKYIKVNLGAAEFNVHDSTIFYGDQRYDLDITARNLNASVQPDSLEIPEAQRGNRVTISADKTTVIYNGNKLDYVGVNARGHVTQTRADIEELILRAPFTETTLRGTVDDIQKRRYRMEIVSTVDLMQAADTFQLGATLRGTGNINGIIEGEGSQYKVDANFKADALAAENIRLQGLNVTANGTGDGATYDLTGNAVADLLTAGAFRLDSMQLAGQVMGTGTDFRYVGDLKAAAARYGNQATIANLILSDARAEMRDGELRAQASNARAARVAAQGAVLEGANLGGVSLTRSANGQLTARIDSAQVNAVNAQGNRIKGLRASGVDIKNDGGNNTSIVAQRVNVGGIDANGVEIGSLNIAGVRLSVRNNGNIEGTSGDINVGNVRIAQTNSAPGGKIENVRLARPVFVLENVGRYRASADLSLGGGVLGSIRLGAARAKVAATQDEIQLNNLDANILDGRASGNARINTGRGASRADIDFTGVEIGGLISTLTGRAALVTGRADGTLALAFPGTDVTNATGKVNATFNGETASESGSGGRTPLNGVVALTAERGVFQIDNANLRTPSSELTATGRFSVARSETDLNFNVTSTDARELQATLLSTGVAPEIEAQLNQYGIGLGGTFAFNGNIKGRVDNPFIEGRASVASLLVGGQDAGSLSANISVAPTEINVRDGSLRDRDGGSIAFDLNAPRTGTDNIALNATLDNASARSFLALVPRATLANLNLQPDDIAARLNGRVNVSGLPNKASGNLEITSNGGYFKGERIENLTAKASFDGTRANIENITLAGGFGRINAQGTVDYANFQHPLFDVTARGENVDLAWFNRLQTPATAGAAPAYNLSGIANLNLTARGDFFDVTSYNVTLDADSRNAVINGINLSPLTLTGRTQNQQLNVNLTTGVLGTAQTVAANVDLSKESLPATIETRLDNANLSPLLALFAPQFATLNGTGQATGAVKIVGELNAENAEGEREFGLTALSGEANFTAFNIAAQEVQLVAQSPLIVKFNTQEINFERAQFIGGGTLGSAATNLNLSGTFGIGAGGHSNLAANGKLDLRLLDAFIPDTFFRGTVDAMLRVTGDYNNTRVNGTAGFANAKLDRIIGDQRLTLSNVGGTIRFNDRQAEIASLTGFLGGGRVSATGGALLNGFVPLRYRFDVRGDNVTVPLPSGFRSTADATLSLSGTQNERLIRGDVRLLRSEYTQEIDIADFLRAQTDTSLESNTEPSAFAATTQLDIRVDGRDALVVKNNQADVLGSVALRVGGTLDEPVPAGRVTVSRGTIEFRNERYEIVSGTIDLPPQINVDPIVNLRAESEIKGYQVFVDLSGSLSELQANVRSNPALPQNDIVALITTGDLDPGYTGGSALGRPEIGTAASLIADTLINAPAQRATDKLFGLNRFEIDPRLSERGEARPRLTLGRRVNNNLTITYSTNLTADQSQIVAVEYRVSNRLSFVAQYEQGSVNDFASRGNNFSFEVRLRKRF